MFRNFILLFLALRAADILNVIGGMWLVPKFVAPEDLGAVLPLTTFATLVAIPIYAVAMTALREASRLRAESARSGDRSPSCSSDDNNRGCGILSAPADAQLQSFIRGVFAASGVGAVLALAIAAALLPRYIHRVSISDSLSGYLAVSAALLGCVSPIYLDQLQAAKRFGSVSIIEISAAALRLCVMAALMPFRALAGYFAGGIIKPLVQILGPLLALYRDGLAARSGDRSPSCSSADNNNWGFEILSAPAAQNNWRCGVFAAPYWTRENLLRLARLFLLLLPYLALPMYVSFMENDLVRTLLPAEDSAGYYMATRISDLLNYITFPILFVMFPYITEQASRGESYAKTVLNSCGVVTAVAIIAILVTNFFGTEIISLLPNGENYVAYAKHLPMLIFFMAFGACQSIITNACAAAGEFKFLWWFIPLNVAYIEILPHLLKSPKLDGLIAIFLVFAIVRTACAMIQLRFSSSRK